MTQKELVLAYVQEFGSILPAKLGGKFYKGEIFGSETSKRCRELRAEGKLISEGDGKFERFYLPHQTQETPPGQEIPPRPTIIKPKKFIPNQSYVPVCCQIFEYSKTTHSMGCSQA